MGSLMAGWDSPVQDPKAVIYQRNKSFTKGEIDAYWKAKKRVEEEHLKAISMSQEVTQENTYKEGRWLQRAISLTLTDRKGNVLNVDSEQAQEKLNKDWWTRTNWAFLNEPPVIATEGCTYNYKRRFILL